MPETNNKAQKLLVDVLSGMVGGTLGSMLNVHALVQACLFIPAEHTARI